MFVIYVNWKQDMMKFTTSLIIVLNVMVTCAFVAQRPSCPTMDEFACLPSPYMYPRCIPVTSLCDGRCDCPLGDDEKICSLIQPTVTSWVTTTLTVSKTTTATITPTMLVNATSLVNITVSYSETSGLVKSTYTADVSPGDTYCSIVTSDIVPTDTVYWYTPDQIGTSQVSLVFTLPCSMSTTYP